MLTITTLTVALTLPQAQAQEKKEPNQILITNVNVWDGTSDATKKVDVLVEGNKIKRIRNINAPKAIVIDGKGVIRKLHLGFFKSKTAEYENAIKNLLHEAGNQ